MKTCAYCGAEMADTAQFCPACGRGVSAASAAAVQEYAPPAFESHEFEAPVFEPHPYEPTDYSSVHVYGPDETPQFVTPNAQYGDGGQPRRRAGTVVRYILGGLGCIAVLLLSLGAKWSGDMASAILLLVAAVMLLPVPALDRIRRRFLPQGWLRGVIIAALIILALCVKVHSDTKDTPAEPQTAVTQTDDSEAEDAAGFSAVTEGKIGSLKD